MNPRRDALVLLALAGAALLPGCKPRKLADGLPAGEIACNACHGDAESSAPPRALHGGRTTADPEVGAHRLHLRDSPIRSALGCEECHLVPATIEAPGHVDSVFPSDPAEIVWGPLARAGGLSPSWDRESATCAATWCHGGGMQGGLRTAPRWTYTEEPPIPGCDACHGSPPPSPHPQVGACDRCHPKTARPDGSIDVASGEHLNGEVDIDSSCSACHGSGANAAPPLDTKGGSDTSSPGVGAHQAHLTPTALHDGVACEECHVVPKEVGEPGHILHERARVVWGPLARAAGASPAYDGQTCSGVYCHGAKSDGGSHTAPRWTKVDGTEAACGACHGAPPPDHYGSACWACHPDVDLNRKISDLSRHVDGKLDVSSDGTCGSCHGLPPSTGAHPAHYGDTSQQVVPTYSDTRALADWFPAGKSYYMFGCGNCHPLNESKHMDGYVQIELHDPAAPAGSLKAKNVPQASYDVASGSCSKVYCHTSGQDVQSSKTSPGWRSGQALGCDGCHGNPPRYTTGGAGAIGANTHLQLADDGWEFGHFGGLPGAWHQQPNPHGSGGARDASPMTCQTCHFATTDPADVGPSGFFWLNTTGNYLFSGGDPERLGKPLVGKCDTCHVAGGAAKPGAGKVLPLKHVNGKRDVVFDARATAPASYPGQPSGVNAPKYPYWVSGADRSVAKGVPGSSLDGTTWSVSLANAKYDAATKTCTNVACHLKQTSVKWGRMQVGFTTCDACHQFN